MLSQLVLLQLTALVATASAVGIHVNVLVGKDLGDEDDDKGTRCWSPEKVEESKRNEEQFWKDQSRIAEDPRWSTAWDFYFATARTTDLSQEDMSSFMALESSMMLEYHSTNPYFWTYTSFRQSDETTVEMKGNTQKLESEMRPLRHLKVRVLPRFLRQPRRLPGWPWLPLFLQRCLQTRPLLQPLPRPTLEPPTMFSRPTLPLRLLLLLFFS